MSIIRYSKNQNVKYAYLQIFPDQFKTEKEKEEESFIKDTMDYFSNRAYAEYVRSRNTFVKNYDLVKGILRREDFYEEPETKTFTQMLEQDLALPAYVKHYSIITTPLNELVGEISKRPDGIKVKAFDDNSKSEELAYKTEILNNFVLTSVRNTVMEDLKMKGEEIDEEQVEQLTMEQVKDDLDNYTSVAEKWANRNLECMKADFNIKEKSEDAFRDMCITAREFYHIYEDNSKVGFNVEVANPKNTWFLTTPDKKYISDPSGRNQGAYAAGTVQVMDISEIIEAVPDLTKEEIDHLRSSLEDYGLIGVRESNLFSNPTPGIDSIKYDTYDPLVLQTRMMIESEMKDNHDNLQDFLGLTNNVSAFGYKYVVIRAYWISKKKIGRVTYIDKMGNIQTELVDEHYKSKTIPTQISLEWGWINQWYQGIKIGPDIYHVKPFNLLPYCPIIGITYEVKNTEAKSLIDMMKPFQVLYNVCMNQLYRLLEKEIGNVARVSLRRVPRVKDGDAQDDIDIWEMEARERGIMFDDDSPENTKGAISNQTVAGNVDLTRTNEMQSRYNLAVQLKNECWELIGMSKQRLGSITASESATGTNAAIQQSYSQTEPLFVAHEYVLLQLYQAIIDAALYVESQKPESTISYISSQGESAFVQVNGTDLKFRDLKVFPTNRPEDKKRFEELRMLAQPLLQNGGSFQDVIELYSTDSVRQMKKVFKVLKDKQDQLQQQQMQQEQQKIDQEAQFQQAQLEQSERQHQETIANEDRNKQLDRISKERIAIIQATGFGKVESEDVNQNQVPDVLETQRLLVEQDEALKDYQSKMSEIAQKSKEHSDKMRLENRKIDTDLQNQKNDLQIAKIQAKSKPKPTAKKK